MVGYNPIGDDGVSVLIDHLYSNAAITELYVHICGFSAKGIM